MGETLAAEPAAAGSLDRHHVACGEIARRLRRERLAVQEIAAGHSRLPPAFALRRAGPPFADQREPAILERLELAYHALAAAVTAGSAGSTPQRVAPHP